MNPFVPREKMSKRARRELDRKQRKMWARSPVTRTTKNPKAYDRKKSRQWEEGDLPDRGFFIVSGTAPFQTA